VVHPFGEGVLDPRARLGFIAGVVAEARRAEAHEHALVMLGGLGADAPDLDGAEDGAHDAERAALPHDRAVSELVRERG